MRYIIVDGELGGTGLRDKYDREFGFIEPKELNLSDSLILQIEKWKKAYEELHYYGYVDRDKINKLDTEGIDIAKKIATELKDVKVEYFSDANLVTFLI